VTVLGIRRLTSTTIDVDEHRRSALHAAWWRWSATPTAWRCGRRRQAPPWLQPGTTDAASWMLTQPIQPGPHHFHGDAAIVAVGHVEDVAGDQLDSLDLAHGTRR
jgi:hypothetical protein